jgi:hypothetical protein
LLSPPWQEDWALEDDCINQCNNKVVRSNVPSGLGCRLPMIEAPPKVEATVHQREVSRETPLNIQ